MNPCKLEATRGNGVVSLTGLVFILLVSSTRIGIAELGQTTNV